MSLYGEQDLRSGYFAARSIKARARKIPCASVEEKRLRGRTNDDRFCRRSLLLLLIFPLMTVSPSFLSPSPRYPLLARLPSSASPLRFLAVRDVNPGRCTWKRPQRDGLGEEDDLVSGNERRAEGSSIRIAEFHTSLSFSSSFSFFLLLLSFFLSFFLFSFFLFTEIHSRDKFLIDDNAIFTRS